MPDLIVPTTGIAAFVQNLARQHNVRYIRSPADELADVATRLAGDQVKTDEIEDLIVELRRSKVINSETMVALLGNYLEEKKAQERS